MATRPPAGFTPIAEAFMMRDGTPYNLIGVCTDSLPPRVTYGTDATMKLVLWDPSCADNLDLGSKGMVVRYFRQDLQVMPNVQDGGDVVILRNIVTRNTKGLIMGLSNRQSRWNILPASSLADCLDANLSSIKQRPMRSGQPGTPKDQGPIPSEKELRYAKQILMSRSSTGQLEAPQSTADTTITAEMVRSHVKPASLKFRLVKDLRDQRNNPSREFVDLVGEIQHVFLDRNPVEVKITDYTQHPCLYQASDGNKDGDEYGYTSRGDPMPQHGPPMCITLNAWDSQGDNIRNLAATGQIGLEMFVEVKNVCIKLNRNGTVLEGHLRSGAGESNTSFSIFREVQNSTHQALRNLLKRRLAYREMCRAEALGLDQKHQALQTSRPEKRPASADAQDNETNMKFSKNSKRRQKVAKKTNVQQPGKQLMGQIKDIHITKTNPNIRCLDQDVSLTSLAVILDEQRLDHKTVAQNEYKWHFQNLKYKSRVRVIDFFPPDLEDFTTFESRKDVDVGHIEGGSKVDTPQSPDKMSDSDHSEDHVWRWHFFLMVEDANVVPGEDKGMMLLQVSNEDGDYLFNMEACDLRQKTGKFHEMKAKLFLLWGELHEKMVETNKNGFELHRDGVEVKSMPFECLIKEFGVLRPTQSNSKSDSGQWERMHGLFGTRIVE